MATANKKHDMTTQNGVVKWGDHEFHVKQVLPITEAFRFVNSVVELCFNDNGDYMPEVRRFAELIETVRTYTDIEIPEETSEQYDMVYSVGLVESLEEYINEPQYLDLIAAVQDKINIRRRDKRRAIDAQMNELYASLSGMLSTLETMFGNLDSAKVSQIIENIASMNFSEESLVKTILAEKSKTEV